MMKVAVLASGKGTNFMALLEHIREGRIKAKIVLVLSNVPDAPALTFAKNAGIPVWSAPHKNFPSRAAFDAAMLAAMCAAGVEGVVLAGYMRLLSSEFIRAYSGKIINIHPSLLPSFPGTKGGPDALAYGVKLAGCTVHFVVEDMDAGAVIIQAALPVNPTDTEENFMPRVHALEHRIFPQALAWLAEGRLSLEGRTVRLLPPFPVSGQVPPVPDGTNSCAGLIFADLQPPCLINPPLEKGF